MAEHVRAGTLYVVATPIGNLEDMTFRAVRLLKEVSLIACEDTRQTQKLLHHYGIATKTVSYHEHNERERTEELLGRLAAGDSLALVSDAGTPGVSDPGYRVISAAVAAGYRVVPLPGAAAVIAAVAASGLPTDEFTFRGFLPAKAGQRQSALQKIRDSEQTEVFYEAPHRLAETLRDVAEVLGAARPVVVARELTKVHEEFVRGSAAEVLAAFADREVKGEIVLLIGKGAATGEAHPAGTMAQRLRELMQEMDEKDALKIAAREFGVSKSEAYREWQRSKAGKR